MKDIKKAEAIKAYKPELDKAIYDLLEKHRELGEIDSKRKELGNKSGIEAEINKLQTQKEQLSKALSISENDIKMYVKNKLMKTYGSKKV